MLNAPHHCPERCTVRHRARCWSSLLLLAAACAGRSSEELPSAPPLAEPGPGSPALQPAVAAQPALEPSAEPRSLTWAVPAGGSPVALSLKVALDAGGGQAQLNAAGEILINGATTVGSGEDAQDLVALTRRDARGAGRWAQAYAQDARLLPVLEDDGSTLAAGHFAGRLNLAGAQLESSYNPVSAFGSATSGSTWRGQPSQDIVLFRLTPQGDVAWARRFGEGGDQSTLAIERAAAGELVVVGHFVGQLVMDGLRVTSSGGGSRADVFIAHFDRDGQVSSLWREAPLQVDATTVARDGSLWIAGRESNLTSNRLWKLSPDGQRQLSLVVDDEGGASASTMAAGPDGSVYVLYNGTERAPLFGRRSAGYSAIVRLSPAGEVEWLRPLQADFVLAYLAADAVGNVAVTGLFRTTLDLGAGPLVSSGDVDFFVAGYSAQGDLRYSLQLGSSGFDGVNGITARPSGGWLIPFYTGAAMTLGDQPVAGGEHLLWVDEH